MTLVEEALARLEKAWGRTPALGLVHAEHHERAVFEIVAPSGPAVVKVDTSRQKHAKERAVLAVAAEAGLPVPPVVYADAEPPAVLVLQRRSGPPLSLGTSEAWRHAGELVRGLHEQSPPAEVGTVSWSDRTWVDHFAWWAGHEHHLLSERQALPDATLEEVHRLLSDAFGAMKEPDPCLLHGDCQPDHYRTDNRRSTVTCVLDFGDAVLGDPAWDLAVLTLAHPHHVPDVLAGYGPDGALAGRAERLLLPYWLIRRLGSARWMHEHGYDDTRDLRAAEALLRERP